MTAPSTALVIRPARAEDKAAVLAFAQHTWDWGDYLQWVWDAWLADPRGSLVVAEIEGRVVAVDMLSEPRPGEGWFQGLRVDPAYRGRGIALALEVHQLAVARERGLHTLRFMTLATNTPVHKNALRHGFTVRSRFLAHRLELPASAHSGPLPSGVLRVAPADAAALWARIPAGPLWAPSTGCLGGDWVFAAFAAEWWPAIVASGAVWRTADEALIVLNPGLRHVSDPDEQWLAWIDPGADGLAAAVATAGALCTALGARRLETMWPREPALEAALAAAGWQPDRDDETMLLFALELA